MDAVSPIAVAAEKLARMVALSPTFRGELSPEAAAARIHRRFLHGAPARPAAAIGQADAHSLELIAGGAQNHLRESGQLVLYLTRDTPPEFHDDPLGAEADAANWFGAVARDVAALSAADDPTSPWGESHLAIVRMQRQALFENDEEDWNSLGRFFFTLYAVDWGDQ